MKLKALLLGTLASLILPVYGQSNCANQDKVFGQISYQVEQPHQLVEEHLDSPWLSFMYQPTRHSTLKKYLTFTSGEEFDQVKLDESLRKLRAAKFIWDAKVDLTDGENCAVNVLITATDTFPFKPKLSLSYRSGTSRSSIGINNTNLFGTGNRLEFLYKQSKLREQKVIKYENPNFGDGHYLFSGVYSDNSDGKESAFRLAQPFHGLDSVNHFDVSFAKFTGDLQLFDNAEESFITQMTTKNFNAIHGISNGKELGFERSRMFFYANVEQASYSELAPLERDVISIGSKFRVFDTDYIAISNIRNMTKTEDYNQGRSVTLDLGIAYDRTSQLWGKTIAIDYSENTVIDEQTLLLTQASYYRAFFGNHLDESRFSGLIQLNYFQQDFQQSWNARLHFDLQDTPKPENYLVMDEEFGIRGFPYGYILGDSAIKLNLEKRWFNLARFFDVFDIAATSFLDAAVISSENSPFTQQKRTRIQSVGLGLRISPTKLSNNTVVHIDLAFPVQQDLEQNYQFSIYATNHF